MTKQITFDKDPATGEPVAILEGRFTISDVMNILKDMAKLKGGTPEAVTSGSMDVIPLVSSQTGEPRVELQSENLDRPLQLDIREAYDLATVIMEVAGTAMNDAVVFGFFHTQLGIEKNIAAQMLHAMRGYREEMFKNGGKDEPGDNAG